MNEYIILINSKSLALLISLFSLALAFFGFVLFAIIKRNFDESFKENIKEYLEEYKQDVRKKDK